MIQILSPGIDDATRMQMIAWQCARLCGCSVLFLAVAVSQCVAADERQNDAQQRVTAICQKLQTATVRVRSGSDTSSGVIVSKNGLVLTVAHGLKPDSGRATVVFSNGKTCEAKLLVFDELADVALLAVDVMSLTEIDWSIAPVSVAEDSVIDEVVLAAGFPAREPDGMQPVVRLGEILAVDRSAVNTSCTLTSGDSGGPLVNSRGELIGLHRQIGAGAESNGHVALSAIREALEKTEHWKTLTQLHGGHSGAKFLTNQLMASPLVAAAARRATVAIRGSNADGQSAVRVLGTVLDDYHVATKLSEIVPYSSLTCQFADGSTIGATLSKSERTLDLALLKLALPYDDGKAVKAADSGLQHAVMFSSQIVFAATSLTDVSPAGIIGRILHDEPGLPARFGATMQSDAARVRITELSPNGSAVLAGLQVGDELRAVDATDVTSLQAMGELLMARQPGDWVLLDIHRARERFRVPAQLQHNPGQQFEKTEFLDGRTGRVSQRRSGFSAVLQHDIPIEPAACGGPLLDDNGHVTGISIARRARESTLAIPMEDVLKFADPDE